MKNKILIEILPIETERLIIKPTSIDDIDLILKMDKQEHTQLFLGGIKQKTKKERIQFLENKYKQLENGYISSLTVYLKETNLPIGFLGFCINEQNNSAEISYIFDFDYTKRGYCFESMSKLLQISFKILKLDKLFADVIEENISSIKILKNLNFKLDGTNVKKTYVEHLKKDCNFINYSILATDYENGGLYGKTEK